MDIALLLFLILLNGVLAMSEIAVVSSRQSRLKKLADDGSVGARSALALHHEPATFLSTVQVGITTVGILSGAIEYEINKQKLTSYQRWYAPPPIEY
jgi:putative hemolysin